MGWIEPSKIQRTILPEKYHALKKIKFNTYRRYRLEYISPEPLLEICCTVLDRKPLPNITKWTVEEVASYLKDLGFPEFQEAILKNFIDGKSLLFLEADKFPKLNIKNFEKIKMLTSVIRELHHVDQDEFKRCINLPCRRPGTLYLEFKCSRTGSISNSMRPSSYFRKIKIIRDETTEDRRYYALANHWNRIPPYREWCPHVLIGNIRRVNPMTGTTMRQNIHPGDHPYLLKETCFYSLPCQFEIQDKQNNLHIKQLPSI